MTAFAMASAFLAGLLGGVHCLGMCGGIVGALASQGRRQPTLIAVGYNLGRISAYIAAGAGAGALGSAALLLEGLLPAERILYTIANVLLVALGLYLAGMSRAVLWLERPGVLLWKRIEPLGRGLFPVDTVGRAVAIGALWGFLPCGMVYTMLVAALATRDPMLGAATLAAFGLGTLPNLLALALVADRVVSIRRNAFVRLAAGLAIAVFGIVGLLHVGQAGDPASHHHHHQLAAAATVAGVCLPRP